MGFDDVVVVDVGRVDGFVGNRVMDEDGNASTTAAPGPIPPQNTIAWYRRIFNIGLQLSFLDTGYFEIVLMQICRETLGRTTESVAIPLQ